MSLYFKLLIYSFPYPKLELIFFLKSQRSCDVPDQKNTFLVVSLRLLFIIFNVTDVFMHIISPESDNGERLQLFIK
jgi:hypothetical protein